MLSDGHSAMSTLAKIVPNLLFPCTVQLFQDETEELSSILPGVNIRTQAQQGYDEDDEGDSHVVCV